MIKNVIFDIGKVLISFDWDSFVNGYFDEKTAAAVTRATWHNPDWSELDKGILSFEEVMQLFIAKEPDYEEQIRFIMEHLGECPQKHDYAIKWVDELRASGYNVYYLSNYFEYLINVCPQVLDFIPHMNGGIFSYREQVIKPDHEIYRRLCDRYGLCPSECIFIDDSIKNVDGAESFEIKAFLFESYEKNYHEIMEYIRNS